MGRFIILIIFLTSNSYLFSKSLESKISNMIIIGFEGSKLSSEDSLYKHLQNYPLGGVVLFDKNIKSLKQLRELTYKLKSLSNNYLIIAVDEEGGLVSRVGKLKSFKKIPSATTVAKRGRDSAKRDYLYMAKMLKEVGVNSNFAPVVDIAVNPENSVIVKNGRSFSEDVDVVVEYASIFIEQMQKEGIMVTLKHFPGHGSSLDDSHFGFVDVSSSWSKSELVPFKRVIKRFKIPMIMTAHIYNKHIDTLYPATLSYKTNQKLLREKLGYNGIIVSDDLQMGAISKHYTLRDRVSLAINSGVDMLLFANQIDKPIKIEEVIETIKDLIKEGKVDRSLIDKADRKIDKLKREYL